MESTQGLPPTAASPAGDAFARTGLRVTPVADSPTWRDEWDRVVAAAPEAWCWHSRKWLEFVKEVDAGRRLADRSFFVRDPKGTAVALCPLLVTDVVRGVTDFREAGYNGGPLPWPCVATPAPDRVAVHAAILAHAEGLARAEQADVVRFRLSGPAVTDHLSWFSRLVSESGYIDGSYPSHLVRVDDEALHRVRGRVRRYLRRWAGVLDVRIAAGVDVTAALEDAFFDLHVKDAGRQVRSRRSYTLMADLARAGEGFFVVARLGTDGPIAGVLLVSTCGAGAYDSSVAVDPDHQDKYVSHAMKHRAIEHLQHLGIRFYELGRVAGAATWACRPTTKERGISEFKRAWAREGTTPVLVAEKLLSADACERWCRQQCNELREWWFPAP